MAPLAKKLNKKSDEKFSYADYLSWPDDEEGVAYNMSPAPAREHRGQNPWSGFLLISAKLFLFRRDWKKNEETEKRMFLAL